MTDTAPKLAEMQRDKLMALSGEQRFIMGAQMFDAAVEMVKASLPRDLSEVEMRRELFKRLYGNQIDIDQLIWI